MSSHLLVMKYSVLFCMALLLTYLSPIRAQDEGKKGLGKYVWSGKDYAVGFVGGTLAVAAVPLVLSSLGFTTTGVAAGSAAAAIQSAVYGGSVTSGSIFAVLQSLGAGGLGMKASSLVYNFGSDMAIYFMKMVAPDEEESKCS